MTSIDEYEAAVRAGASAEAPQPREGIPSPPGGGVQGEPRRLRRNGRETLRGRLVRMDCEGTLLKVHLNVDGRTLTFENQNGDGVVLQTPSLMGQTEEIVCNTPIDREVEVEFDPDGKGPQSGLLKGVVFLTPPK